MEEMRSSLKASVTREKDNLNEQADLNIPKSKERHFILDRKSQDYFILIHCLKTIHSYDLNEFSA